MKAMKTVIVLLILSLALSMNAQEENETVKFVLTSYQRIDLREDSDRYDEKDFVNEQTLMIIEERSIKLSGSVNFDLVLTEQWEDGTEPEQQDGITASSRISTRVVDVDDGEKGLVEIWHIEESDAGEFWGVYLVFPHESEMYFQFTASPRK